MGFFGKTRSGDKVSGGTGAEVWESFFALVMKKDLKGALSCLDRLAKLEPKNPQVFLKRAELLQRKKDIPGAVGAYHTAASLIEGQKAKAIYKIILRLSPDDAKAKKGMDAPVITNQAAKQEAEEQTSLPAPTPEPIPPPEPVLDAQPTQEEAGESLYGSLESAGLELGGMDDEGGIELDGAAAYDEGGADEGGADDRGYEETTPTYEQSDESSEPMTGNEPETSTGSAAWDDGETPKEEQVATGSLDWEDEQPAVKPQAAGDAADWDDGETPKEEQAATGSLDFEEEEPAKVSTGSLNWDDGETPKEEQPATGSLDFDDEQPAIETEAAEESDTAAYVSNPLVSDDNHQDESNLDEPAGLSDDIVSESVQLSDDAPETDTQESDTIMQQDSMELEGGIELDEDMDEDGAIELDGGMAQVDIEAPMALQDSVADQDEQADAEIDSSLWTADAPVSQNESQRFELPPVLSFLSIEDIESLPDRAAHMTYDEGQPIISEGDASDSMFIIKSGQARVETMIKGESVVLGQLGPGDIFGEVAFLTGKPRTASVFASDGPLEVMEINRELLKATIENNPLIMDGLLEMYQGRARDTIKQMRESVR